MTRSRNSVSFDGRSPKLSTQAKTQLLYPEIEIETKCWYFFIQDTVSATKIKYKINTQFGGLQDLFNYKTYSFSGEWDSGSFLTILRMFPTVGLTKNCRNFKFCAIKLYSCVLVEISKESDSQNNILANWRKRCRAIFTKETQFWRGFGRPRPIGQFLDSKLIGAKTTTSFTWLCNVGHRLNAVYSWLGGNLFT